MNTWKECASDFFLEYVKPQDRNAYADDGNLTVKTMNEAAKMLLDEKIFQSIADMKAEAARDYNVILPEELFDRRF